LFEIKENIRNVNVNLALRSSDTASSPVTIVSNGILHDGHRKCQRNLKPTNILAAVVKLILTRASRAVFTIDANFKLWAQSLARCQNDVFTMQHVTKAVHEGLLRKIDAFYVMKASLAVHLAARTAHSLPGARIGPLLQRISDIPNILRQRLQSAVT
jgi:hypothetical protein